MANTYTLISSTVLGSPAASVTFSSIPGTYTDLVVKGSARDNAAILQNNFYMLPNSETTASANGTTMTVFYNSDAAYSTKYSSTFPFRNLFNDPGNSATANTFSNWESYIPSYAGSQDKVLSHFGVMENNAVATGIFGFVSSTYSSASAITQLVITCNSSNNFATGSSFYLYGIKNS